MKNTIKNDKNHKKINNQLNNFKAEIGKSAKQLQAEQKNILAISTIPHSQGGSNKDFSKTGKK